MGQYTKIQWTDSTFGPGSTFNPVRGCTKISPGCANCYAERFSHRNPGVLGIWGPNGTREVAAETAWKEPLKWNRRAERGGYRHKVFCASLSDVFENREEWLAPRLRLWDLIRKTPCLDWLLLTKRPENINTMMPAGSWPNVWLGVSVENQEYTWRLDALQEIKQKVPVRFCSAEPLLEPLRLAGVLGPNAINWAIIGGESGPKARPFRFSWAMSLLAECRSAGVACFIKQVGSNPIPDTDPAIRITDKKGGNWDEFPAWMQVREFPKY